MQLSERAQRSVESIQEDERLRGDLDDQAAAALVAWATALASTIADDPQRSDSEVEAAVQMIRSAARTASRSGIHEPQQVVAAAAALSHQYAALFPYAPHTEAEKQPASNLLHKHATDPDSETTPSAAVDELDQPASQGVVRTFIDQLTNPESQHL